MDHLNPAHEEKVAGENGLSHDGDPEVEVIEEGEEEEDEVIQAGPKVLKAPRAPTQREIDEHMATHLPHAAWWTMTKGLFALRGRTRRTRDPLRAFTQTMQM